MPLNITITDAGRAEIINAENTGSDPVLITEIGLGTGEYVPSPTQTDLVSETKRLTTFSGEVVADDTIHVFVKDEGNDAYNVTEFGLFSASGTLIAVYSQVGDIMQKTAQSSLLLAVDIVLSTINAASLTFGDTSFTNPPATTEALGVVELATQTEMNAETDPARVPAVSVVASYVAAKIAALVDSSPGTLDTLNELAAALGDDPNFATTMTNALATKLAKSGNQTYSNGTFQIVNDGGLDIDAGLTGVIKGIQIRQPVAGADALMEFHVGGDFAGYFGLAGSINDLVVGGYSYGSTAKHRIWHDGNGPPSDGEQYVRKDGAWSVVDAIPVGAGFVIFADSPPAGMLELDGAELSRATYAALWTHAQSGGNLVAQGSKQAGNFGNGDGSTTFTLPDLRGEFLRGWDHGRGVDTGRTIGSSQLDQMQRITGRADIDGSRAWQSDSGSAAGAMGLQANVTANTRHNATASGTGTAVNFDSANSPNARVSTTTAGETRPRNNAVMFCIKY